MPATASFSDGAPAGRSTPAVKLVFCLRRRSDLTVEAFERYWSEVHAPLVRRAFPLIGATRYVQVRRTHVDAADRALQRPRQAPKPFDGIAEMWWADMDAFKGSLDTPEARAASEHLVQDEANFIDLPASPIWLAYDAEIVALTR